ncbi:DUF2341 domain-containing protein [Chloroflexota bacterium]
MSMRFNVKGLYLGLIRLVLVAVLVLPVIGVSSARASPGWYDTDWQYRKKITINSANVTANLTDFPVLINLSSDSDLASDAQNDGDDILFTAADETTKLSHEIEKFNDSTGELVAWVRIPSLSATTDTEIYMYYGYASAANQEDVTGVWDSHYVAVWHLKEDPSGSAPQMADSTSNSHDGTTHGSWSSSNQVTGLIDGSLDFNSGYDKVKVGTFDVVAGGSADDGITLETWFYSHEVRDGRFISKASGTDTNQHWWMLNALEEGSEYRLRFRLKTAGTTTLLLADPGNTVPLDQWVYAAATYDGSNMRIYQDASQVSSTAKSGTISTHSNIKVAVGNQPPGAGSRRFDGLITEVRVSDIARSTGWIETSNNNYNSPSAFYTLGAEAEQALLPTVTTDNATLVEETTATLHGTITDDGGEAGQYRFEYGTVSGGPYSNNTGWTGSITTGQPFSANVTGLGKGTKYYFRAQTKNSAGTGSGAELDFLTKPDAPVTFSASTAGDTQINLSWTKGDGAVRTMVRGKIGSSPTDRSDGYQVYFDTGTSVSDTSLTPGTTYYYKSWSEVTGSQQWSDGFAATSTTTTGGGGPPTAVGGTVFKVDKTRVLAPWFILFSLAALAMGNVVFRLRKSI